MATLRYHGIDLIGLFSSLLFCFLLAIVSAQVPLEEFLSEYVFYSSFKWYIPWRISSFELMAWFVSLALYSFNVRYSRYFLFSSLLFFLLSHYYLLYLVHMDSRYLISLYPFFYKASYTVRGLVGDSLYLDTGQVSLACSTAILFPWNKLFLSKSKKIVKPNKDRSPPS